MGDMSENQFFKPTEIIFAGNSSCNLKCAHCYVSRNANFLSVEEAVRFLHNARNSKNCTIEKIGFSGGEPFLYLDFLEAVIEEAISLDFMFDRLMTNGVWWKDENELEEKLKRIYDAGFDGKIGLSWDYFHGQDFEKSVIFVEKVLEIFGENSLEIQSVVPFDRRDTDFVKRDDNKVLENIKKLAKNLEMNVKNHTGFFSKKGIIYLENDSNRITVYRTPESFPCSDGRGWKSKKWFKEDYCQGPGQILYVHTSGKIAPCCGFANENERLILGNIKQSYDEILFNAEANPLLKICFESGLLKFAKKIEKTQDMSRRTDDPCTFCDYVCKYGLV